MKLPSRPRSNKTTSCADLVLKQAKYGQGHLDEKLRLLYYYMRNYCNLIGLEQWYFSLIWNTYMWKLQTFRG